VLLDAAEAVLVEHGLVGATIDQITSRAGVAKGTFYLYFRSKDEVVRALQQRHWDGMMTAAVDAAARLDNSDDWWNVVDAFIETTVDFDLEHRAWHRLVAQGWSAPHDDIMPKNEQQMIDLFEARIRGAVERGMFDVPDTQMTSTLLYRAIQGTSHQLCQDGGPIDRDRVVDAIKWFVRRVLEGGGAQ
jgi:AcrR family transcriptional regulator